jgi:hypothetical protein
VVTVEDVVPGASSRPGHQAGLVASQHPVLTMQPTQPNKPHPHPFRVAQLARRAPPQRSQAHARARTLTAPRPSPLSPPAQGKLSEPIKADDCLWNLADGAVELTLTKAEGMHWWRSVLEGDAPIDTQQVEPESSKLDDLDAETRKTVEKMMARVPGGRGVGGWGWGPQGKGASGGG